MSNKKLIGELLREHGCITDAQLTEAVELQSRRKGKLCQILMSLGHLTEDDLLSCLGAPSAVPANVEPFVINPTLMAYVPKDFAYQHEVLPLDRVGNRLTLAMAGPFHASTPAALQEHTGLAVRPVLCARDAVHAAITQYYGAPEPDVFTWAAYEAEPNTTLVLQHRTEVRREAGTPPQAYPGTETIRLRNMLIIIDSLETFPLLPETHMRILDRLNNPDVELHELTPLIEQDPTLAANVLKLANSAAYGTHGGLASVERAVVFLGLQQLRCTLLASSVLQLLGAQARTDLTGLFRDSYRCGLLTRIICDVARFGDRDVAFTAGLLAKIGHIALRMFSEEYVENIEQQAATSETGDAPVYEMRARVEAEETTLGASASELGYHLARHWNLPDLLAHTIRFHDRLDRVAEPAALTVAVALAQHCLHSDNRAGTFGEAETDPALAWLVTAIGQSPAIVPAIEARYRDTINTAPDFPLAAA